MRGSTLSSAMLFSICANAMTLPYIAPPTDILALEGVSERMVLISAVPTGDVFDRTGWVFTTNSAQANYGPYNTMDGNNNTIWHSEYSPVLTPFPHLFTIDMKAVKYVDGISYLPRQDGGKNGNIGQHKIYLSTDGVNFGNPVAYGTWYDDQTIKSSAFELQPARYIRIMCITEAGNRGQFSSAAEFNVYGAPASAYTKPNPSLGLWGPTIDFPLVPVSIAVSPDSGNLLAWSSYTSNGFFGAGGPGQTLTSTFYPATGLVSQRMVTNTQHDMFCSGISYDVTGRVVLTGGDSDQKTSIYTGGNENWAAGAPMIMRRAYNSQVTIGDGRIFNIGGSWGPSRGGKNGEIYSPTANKWTSMPQCTVGNMLTADVGGVFRSDNHGWLFNWKGGFVFQAGPSKQMNWYNMAGTGGTVSAGTRGNDGHSMCGNAAMYDAAAGKILTVGGSPNYQGSDATANAHIVTIGNGNAAATTTNINPMWFKRTFHNSVILPDGKVFITGGQAHGWPFHEDLSILTPEMWNPADNKFVKMTPNRTPRDYHSTALLMLDATVMSCGGGLCTDCSTNRMDCQIYTPPYLLNADGSYKPRIAITGANRVNFPGDTITVTTNGAATSFSMIRYSATTHTVNTDQRRIPLTPTKTGTNTYKITLGPGNVGQTTPGYWMLFAIDAAGTPSKAYTIRIKTWSGTTP